MERNKGIKFHLNITFSYIFAFYAYNPICAFCTIFFLSILYLPVKSVKVLCMPLLVPVLLFICLSLLVGPFFTGKSDCHKIDLVFSVISIIAILVELLQMIWICITSFVASQSVCHSVCIFE